MNPNLNNQSNLDFFGVTKLFLYWNLCLKKLPQFLSHVCSYYKFGLPNIWHTMISVVKVLRLI